MASSRSHYIKTICLKDWWLSRPNEKSRGGELVVGGSVAGRKGPLREFLSLPIIKRHDLFTLESSDGILIVLNGHINKQRTVENGFSAEVFNKFMIGFPPEWEGYVKTYMIPEAVSKVSSDDLYHDADDQPLLNEIETDADTLVDTTTQKLRTVEGSTQRSSPINSSAFEDGHSDSTCGPQSTKQNLKGDDPVDTPTSSKLNVLSSFLTEPVNIIGVQTQENTNLNLDVLSASDCEEPLASVNQLFTTVESTASEEVIANFTFAQESNPLESSASKDIYGESFCDPQSTKQNISEVSARVDTNCVSSDDFVGSGSGSGKIAIKKGAKTTATEIACNANESCRKFNERSIVTRSQAKRFESGDPFLRTTSNPSQAHIKDGSRATLPKEGNGKDSSCIHDGARATLSKKGNGKDSSCINDGARATLSKEGNGKDSSCIKDGSRATLSKEGNGKDSSCIKDGSPATISKEGNGKESSCIKDGSQSTLTKEGKGKESSSMTEKKMKRKLDYDEQRTPILTRNIKKKTPTSSGSSAFKTSRSGRIILPTMEFWRNQVPIYSPDRELSGVQDGTSLTKVRRGRGARLKKCQL